MLSQYIVTLKFNTNKIQFGILMRMSLYNKRQGWVLIECEHDRHILITFELHNQNTRIHKIISQYITGLIPLETSHIFLFYFVVLTSLLK